MGLKLNIYFHTGEIMKKYTLPLCGLAISLGMVSSAMAAPVTGSQTISGTLTAPTCTISMPTEHKIEDVTFLMLRTTTSYGSTISTTPIGKIVIKNCENVSASAMNSAGRDPTALGSGRFTYENNKTRDFAKEPLIYQLERTPNKDIADGRVGNIFRMNGTNTVILKDGDSLNFKLVRGRAPAGNIAGDYIGNYSADLTFTFNYS